MSRKYKFCASCYNYIDSCDCLGNLEDHEHLNDFEREGKDDMDEDDVDEDDKDDGPIYYFRFPVGVLLSQVGNIGTAAMLRIPGNWTTDPPADPTKYLSIPKSRFPMTPHNQGTILAPKIKSPKNPWEIQFFKGDLNTWLPEKTNAVIAKEWKDCAKRCKWRPACHLRCAVAAGVKKAKAEFESSPEDIYVAFDKWLPEQPPGFQTALVMGAGLFVPERAWRRANNMIVPGCGFQWIEMHLIDGSDPAGDVDCSGKLSSNVEGVAGFWNDNQSGSLDYSDYYGENPTDPNMSRSLMMPFVPPPVPKGPPRCTPWAIRNGFCNDDDDQPPYKPPPITTKPPIVDPEDPDVPPPEDPIVLPPIEDPPELTIFDVTEAVSFPMCIAQVPFLNRTTWGLGGDYDARFYPHIKWGSPAPLFETGDIVDQPVELFLTGNGKVGMQCPLRLWQLNAEPKILSRVWLEYTQMGTDGPVPVFTVKGPGIAGESKPFTGRSGSFSFSGPVRAGFDAFDIEIIQQHNNGGVAQFFDLNLITNWDVQCKPIFRRAIADSWYGFSPESVVPQFGGNDEIQYTAGGANIAPKAFGQNVTNLPPMISFGGNLIRVKPPPFMFGNGECYMCHADPRIANDRSEVVKMVNTGGGGITPIQSKFWMLNWWYTNFNEWYPSTMSSQGSQGSYSGSIVAWTK